MIDSTRLNILLTHGQELGSRPLWSVHPWYEILSRMLAPLGVQTYEATTGPQAMAVIEHHPIHLAVVDTRLTANDGLTLLRILERIRKNALISGQEGLKTPSKTGQRIEIKGSEGETTAPSPVKVRFAGYGSQAGKMVCPAVILVTPEQDSGVLQEALKCNAFTVMHDPIDLNLMLDVMARAMKRFHHNQWPL